MNEASTAPVIAIIGPTAAGKTRVGYELARRIGGEVISVDSRQVYRYLDVGTDKISQEERRSVLHHLIDVVDPDQVFTASDFVHQARDAVARIRARQRVPLLVGGTPLYYRAFEGEMLTESLPSDPELRQELENLACEIGNEKLHATLADLDPESAARIHANDRVRVIRALEIRKLTGSPVAEVYATRPKQRGGSVIYFGVSSPRELLASRIAKRAAEQFASGYPEEVAWLLAQGYSPKLPALCGFGYRELVRYQQGEISLDEALNGDIRSTKLFARRQATWFKHFSAEVWYDLTEVSPAAVAEDIEKRMGVRKKAGEL